MAKTVDSLIRVFHAKKAPLNFAGTRPCVKLHSALFGELHCLDGGSAEFDFVLTYSFHRRVFPRAATFRNTPTNTPARSEEELPLTRAATAA